MSGSLRVLEPAVSCRVHSAYSLESFAQCVLELVENGVDAGATSLVVKVNAAVWKVKVSDNGRGIPREELQSLVGERYVSSKRQQEKSLQFGFRGETLASIVQVAQTVEISSRHCFSRLTCCKRFQGGRSSGLVPPPANLSHAGTVVTVHDLFYNLPVRRKYLSPPLEMEKLRNSLCKALLVLPQVSLSLHDDQAGLQLLHAPKASSLLMRFHQLFGKKLVQQTDLEWDQIKTSALFAVQSFGRNNLQLIYMNGRPVELQSMHELVARLLKPVLVRNDQKSTGKLLHHLFYVITIECDMEFDHRLTPSRTHLHLQQERQMTKALTDLVCSFLSSNNLPISHCLPPSISKMSCSSQLTATSLSAPSPPSSLPTPPSVSGQVNTPAHWLVAMDPATSQKLQIHPISGCSVSAKPSLQPQDGKIGQNWYFCSFQSLHKNSRPQNRALPPPSESGRVPISLTSSWINPTFSAGEEAVLNVVRTTAHNCTGQFKFSKDTLKHARVLGQVDRKFIVCLFGTNSNFPGLLVAMDQHAAHERVRLEALVKDLYRDGHVVKTSSVVPQVPLSLSTAQQRVARSFSGKLEDIGVTLVWREGQVRVSKAPAILLERETCSAALLQEMVRTHLEVLVNTGGASAGLPSCLSEVLHSRACHGAIRFGDSLSLRQCKQLIQELGKCSLPFQCAHGRPSLAPLIDLKVLARRCPSLETPYPSLRELKL